MMRSVFALFFAISIVPHTHGHAAGAERPGSNQLAIPSKRVSLTGELKRWHKVIITMDGPFASATASRNPFRDLRMDVVFTHIHSGRTIRVPGYFDADGDSANSSASSGRKWRAILRPDQLGQWRYKISFRHGSDVAVSEATDAGEALAPYDGLSGTFTVSETDKTGRDFRAKGALQYVGRNHLRFAGNGEYFLKIGSDSPENLLAYEDFDNTPNYTWQEGGPNYTMQGATSSRGGGYRHRFSPHVKDWKPGDPLWKGGKGKGLIGAMNYLAAKQLNSQSFLLYNTHGDDRNVSPYIDDEDRTRFSLSKLAQWSIIFDHMEKLGIYMDVKLAEWENTWDHDGGRLGPERRIYYREMIARFGHYLAMNWNIGEENINTPSQQLEYADFFTRNDPYKHLIIIHGWERMYLSLIAPDSQYRGAALQSSFSNIYNDTRLLRFISKEAGTPWVIYIDESRRDREKGVNELDGIPGDHVDPDHKDARSGSLWANIMAGGAGMNSFLGAGPNDIRYTSERKQASMLASKADPSADRYLFVPDVMLNDYREWDKWWDQMRYAHSFFVGNTIPFENMASRNGLMSVGWVLADDQIIVGYFPEGVLGGRAATGLRVPSHLIRPTRNGLAIAGRAAGEVVHGGGPIDGPPSPPSSPTVDLRAYRGSYEVRWYDPRRGGALQWGSVRKLQAGGSEVLEIGEPPTDATLDWVVLIRPISN